MLVRVGTITGRLGVQGAARHNLREIVAEMGADSHINVDRMSDNYVIAGARTAAGVVELERDLLANAEFPRPLRKNSVRAVELVFSLPPDSEINHREFFVATTEWARKFYNVPILSSVAHLDEAAPHCHVLLMPLVDNRLQGSVLIGGKAKFLPMLDDFHRQVASRFGLARQVPQKRLAAPVRLDLAGKALAKLKASHDLLNEPSVKDALLELFATNPAPLAAALGIEMPGLKVRVRTVAEIFTKNCPEKKAIPIGKGASSPIENEAKKDQSLCSVGNGFIEPVIHTEPEQPAHSDVGQPDDYQRTRDDEQEAGCWDTDTGEFVRQQVKFRTTSPSIEQASAQIISLQARRQA